MTHRLVFACGLVACLSAPALGASPQVGEEAPEFGSATWVGKAPRQTSIQALRGEVIFVEKWGVKCPPCVALIKHVQHLHDEHAGKGLHIFAFEAQGHSQPEIEACLARNGHRSYPVSVGGGESYQTDGGIPHGWLIGVDGKVIWQGHPGDGKLDQLITSELAKVRFPGLGRSDFDKALNKSLRAYLERDLGAARREARRVAENEKASERARADAGWLVEKYGAIAREHLAAAEGELGARRYLEAQRTLSWLADTFAKDEEGAAAQAKLDELEKDPAVKKELEAMKRLKRLQAALGKAKPAEKKAALEKFARDEENAGTLAAEEAGKLATS